jgi:hypothetical protein
MLAQQLGLSDADLRSREPLFSAVGGFALLGALLYVLQLTYGTPDLDRLLARTRLAADKKTQEEILQVVGTGDNDLFKAYDTVLKERGFDTLRHDVINQIDNAWPRGVEGQVEKMQQLLRELAKIGEKARDNVRLGMVPVQAAAENPAKMSDLSGPSSITNPDQIRRDPETKVPQLPAENASYLGRSLFTDYLLPVELSGFLLLVAIIGPIAIAHRGTKPERSS